MADGKRLRLERLSYPLTFKPQSVLELSDVDLSLMPNRLARKLNMPRSEFPAKNLDMEIFFPLHYANKTWLSLFEERKILERKRLDR